MCRRYKMMMNIDKLSIEDVVAYVFRLVRVYCIFGIIAIVSAIIAASGESSDLLTLSIVQIVLYVLNIGALYTLYSKPEINIPYFPMITAIFLCVFNFADTMYLLTTYKDWFALFSILGIFVQLCTVYILIKLQGKLKARRDGTEENIQTPIAEAYVYNSSSPAPSAPTVAHASEVYNKA